jgi:hypothetical protein
VQFNYFIFRGLIVNVKRYLRNAANYVSYSLALVFFLHLLFQIGLQADPGYAAAGVVNSDIRISDRVNHTPAEEPNALDNISSNLRPSTLLTQSEYPVRDGHPLGADEAPAKSKETVEPITRAFPIWGEKVRAMGYNLPLPFGVGANFIYMEQGIEIRNLKVDIAGSNLDISGVTFSNASAHDAATTARLDLWLLPFANVYGIFGYINGQAELDVNLPAIIADLPIIGPTPITDPKRVKFNIDYTGTTVGGGCHPGRGV